MNASELDYFESTVTPLRVEQLYGQTFPRDAMLPLTRQRLWLIEHGFVRTVNYSEAGEIVTLGLWGVGDIVGRPLSDNQGYEVECLTPARCRLVRLQDVNVSEVRSRQVQQMETLLNILHCRRIPERMLMFLSWLGEKYGQVSDRGCILDLRLTHQAIAEMIGSTRVTVTRLLNVFESEGKLQKLGQQKLLLHTIL